MKRAMPIDLLREHFAYNPLTGKISAAKPYYRWAEGAVLGSVSDVGHGRQYLVIGFQRRHYYAHRMAWALETGAWPTVEIDHRDGDGTNNRWLNLRDASHAQNIQNIGVPSHNTSGVKGVRYYARYRKWHAQIQARGKRLHLGFFVDQADAVAAYRAASAELHGAFSRTS